MSTETAAGVLGRGDDHTVLGALGALVTAGALAVTLGPLGVPAGLLVVGAWATASVPTVLAIGHLCLAILHPGDPTLGALVLVEAGFLLVLVGPFVRRGEDPRVPVAAVVALPLLLGVTGATLRWFDSPWLAALALAITVSLLAYGLHRYELLRMGLVEP